jgi:hypothetical protein
MRVWRQQRFVGAVHLRRGRRAGYLRGSLLSTKLSADGPALRPDGPRSGRSAPVGRTVRACAEQVRVPSFVLRLLAKIMG